jgi:hypothetical protein
MGLALGGAAGVPGLSGGFSGRDEGPSTLAQCGYGRSERPDGQGERGKTGKLCRGEQQGPRIAGSWAGGES